ncbi:SphA family protein [Paraburkholderia phenoliruptrix]|uniref:SphA family protein n=1 Tax=Paraburkholderia phenoliruptrix TaxID=252970 RepID=UPI001C4E879E|nr:transporter [Paraburkholderia phenoliruptrix]MBW0448115.1 transporter [Paraburkholderia phenoliruptrix]MBW9100222.1 transporter [Paraburkholderia phenoliruptrix]
MNIKLMAKLAGVCVSAAAVAAPAHAFEGSVAPYPAGANGSEIASMPPIPGLFVMQQFNYSFANGLYGNDGQKLPIPFHTSVFSSTTRLLAAYPVTVLGANLYSQLVIPVVSLHADVQGYKSTQNGLSNITVTPVLLRWSVNNLLIATGVDLTLPTGSYSPTRSSSVAVGYLSVQPVLSFRYSVPDGIDLGISNRLLLNQKNSDTNYQSGNGYTAEFVAGWRFGKFEFGVVGNYLNQFSDDKVNGVAVNGNGNRMRSFALGPSIDFQAGPVNINLNYQHGLYAVNTSKSHNVWLNVAMPLWVLGGGK